VPDIGAGQSNSLCQIVAEVLGVPLERVTIYATDSAVTPLAGTSTATRQLYMSGNAVLQAAGVVRASLVKKAAEMLGVSPEEVDLENGEAVVRGPLSVVHCPRDGNQEGRDIPGVLACENSQASCRSNSPAPASSGCQGESGVGIPLADVAALCASSGLPLAHLAQFNAPFTEGLDPETGQGDIWPDFTFGAHAVEVAVDTETGEIEVLKSVACHDVGRAINPAAVRGQIAGGSHQGLGYALMEEYVVEKGMTKTPSLAEYLIPTSCDFPTTEVIVLESGTGVGPFGAKGIGEPALTPAAPAVGNAVADALGVRIFSLPFTPEKVIAAADAGKDVVRPDPHW
jgi:CO/xanthine dehydrogenase Mo-binding subunit